jgi:hypothetical protein
VRRHPEDVVGRDDPLADQFPFAGPGNQIELSFAEIESVVGPLPGAARVFEGWWRTDSGVHAQMWRSAGWSLRSVDLIAERALFVRNSEIERPSDRKPEAPPTPVLRYRDEVHLPLIIAMVLICVSFGAVGFGLRPGTDQPPVVPRPRIQLYVYQQSSPAMPPADPKNVSIDETLIQKSSATVEAEIDIFGSFARQGVAQWNLLTGISQAQPYACPDPYNYVGTAHPDPYVIRNGGLTIDGQRATQTATDNFAGRRMTKAAADTFALHGQSPVSAKPDTLIALGEVDLCWTRNAPLAFDGEYVSAALPTVAVGSAGSSLNPLPAVVTRSLYFENPRQSDQPLTAEYSLQAGSLPTSTDPTGWHWSGGSGALIEITGVNIPVQQHEAFLGFLSGIFFGIAGSALILVLQELLEPIRRRTGARQ